MEGFAKDTRHREHQYDEVPMKFVCTQLPSFIDYKSIYPFIASDLESINFRAPGMLDTYANMRQFSPHLIQELVVNPKNLKEAQKVPLFNHFVESVNPPKGKELSAFFAHRKNLANHVDSMTEDFEERKRLFKAINSYQIPKHMDMKQIITTVGNMLSSFEIGKEVEQQEEEVEEEEEEEVNDAEKSLPIKEPVPLNDENYWDNPVLKAFKIDAGLSTRFSTEKTIKQILVSSFAHDDAPSDILGKHQDAVPSVSCSTVEDFPVLNYIDHVPTETISQILPFAQDLYHGLIVKPLEGRELVKTLLVANHSELGKFVQTYKSYKSDGLPKQVISLLLDASSCSHQA